MQSVTQNSTAFDESFTMDRPGNFDAMTVAGVTDTRTSNQSNQIVSRTQPQASTAPKYDLVGNLTEDDQSDPGSPTPWLGYVYTWDALGRLVQISNRSEQVVAEYRYSADNHRIAWRYPQKTDDTGLYYPVYDHRWRMIGVYKRNAATETGPYTDLWERFYYHNAGLGGMGGSGYIDSVIARDDTPLEDPDTHERMLTRTVNYVQNWRGDVVALMRTDATGRFAEQVRYTAYGRPYSIPEADYNASGTVSYQDYSDFMVHWYASNARADFNLTGAVSAQDIYDFLADWSAAGGATGGLDQLTGSLGGAPMWNNRKGYAGYEHDPVVSGLQLARFRYYRADLGVWTRRDPIGYADGPNLYGYVMDSPIAWYDPDGLMSRGVDVAGPNQVLFAIDQLPAPCGTGVCVPRLPFTTPNPNPILPPITVPTGVPACVAQAWSSDVQQAWNDAVSACGGGAVSISCLNNCPAGVCGATNSMPLPSSTPTGGIACSIAICTNAGSGCPAMIETLVHELAHCRQYCQLKVSNPKLLSCNQRTCMEYNGYSSETSNPCKSVRGQAAKTTCFCKRACASTLLGDPKCGPAANCESRCTGLITSGACRRGLYP